MSLCLHVGAEPTTMEYLRTIPTPPRTSTWCPLGHADVVDMVLARFIAAGYQHLSTELGVNVTSRGQRAGDRMFGLMRFKLANDFALAVGIRNTHDKEFALGITIGTMVFVCDNMAFSGDYLAVDRKRVPGIADELPAMLDHAIQVAAPVAKADVKRFDLYKGLAMGDMDLHHLAVEAARQDIIAPNKVLAVANTWAEPPHKAFRSRTMWSGFNAFTEVMKGTNVFNLPAKTHRLTNLFDEYATSLN